MFITSRVRLTNDTSDIDYSAFDALATIAAKTDLGTIPSAFFEPPTIEAMPHVPGRTHAWVARHSSKIATGLTRPLLAAAPIFNDGNDHGSDSDGGSDNDDRGSESCNGSDSDDDNAGMACRGSDSTSADCLASSRDGPRRTEPGQRRLTRQVNFEPGAHRRATQHGGQQLVAQW